MLRKQHLENDIIRDDHTIHERTHDIDIRFALPFIAQGKDGDVEGH